MAVPNLTANSPVPGSIAWSAFTIQYGGVGYGVGASSTALKYVYWVYNSGSPILSASNTLPNLTADDILLFMNKAGVPINVPASNVVDGSLIVDGTIVGSAIIAGTVHGDRVQAGTIAADRLVADSITANQIAAGAIGTSELFAGSVTASKMTITNLSNMVEDGSFEKGVGWALGTGGAIATVAGLPHGGSKVLRQTSSASTLDSSPTTVYDVAPGEVYYAEALVRKTTAGAVGTLHLGSTTSNAGAGLNYPTFQQTSMSSLVQNTWTKLSGMITIPAASNTLQLRLSMRNDVPVGEILEWDNVILRKASSGELIVDGAITTNKMTANTINGDRITTNTLNADKILANTITGDKVAANAVTANKIAVGDFTNYVPDPNFAFGGNYYLTHTVYNSTDTVNVPQANVPPGKVAKLAGTYDLFAAGNDDGFPLVEGDEFYIDAWVCHTGAGTGRLGLRVWASTAQTISGDGALMGWAYPDFGVTAASAQDAWIKVSGTVKIPTNVTSGKNDPLITGWAGLTTSLDAGWFITGWNVRRKSGGELIVDGAITANKILAGAVTADKVAANSITSNKIAVSDFTNLWANQRFEYASPTIGTTSAEVPPTGGNARLLNVRDHSGSERFPISEGGQFRLEYVAKQVLGTRPLNAGVIMRDSTGAQTATPWIYPTGTLMTDLGNGWGRYFTEVTIPVRTPSAAYADLFFQIGNPNGGPYDTNWVISDVVVRRKYAGELIVDGAISASKLTIGALGQTLLANGGFEDEMMGWIVNGSLATRQAASKRTGSLGVRLGASGSVAMESPIFPIGEGERVSVTGWAKQVTATTGLFLRVQWLNATPGQISTTDPVMNQATTTSWAQYGAISTPAPAGTVQARLQFYNVTGSVDIDDIDVRKALISAHISDGAIVADKIATNAVTAVKIQADAVTAGKVAADAIGAREIQADSITASEIAADTITAAEIAADTITATEIATDAITAVKIQADAITTEKINAGAVTATEIATDAVTAIKIQADAVTATKIATDAVTAGKIDADAITAREIQADTITSAEIMAGTITGVEIQANSIDANHLKVGTLEAGYTLTGQLDVTGAIRVGDSSWTPEQGLVFPGTMVLPSVAGGVASIDAHITARSLTVNKDLNILGMSNKISGQLTLSNGVTNPTIAPTPYSFLPSVATLGNSFGNIYFGAAPHPSDANLVVTAEAFYGAKIRAWNKDTGVPVYLGDPGGWASTGPVGFNPTGGITTLGGFYYLLGTDSARGYRWFIYKISADMQTKLAEVEYVQGAGGRPAIGNDGTNIMLAASSGGNEIYVNYYNANLVYGTGETYATFANIGNSDLVSVAKGSFDFGSNRVVFGVHNIGAFVCTPTPNPVRDDTYLIPSPGGVVLRGHVWMDGRFWSFDKDARWYKHGKNTGTQSITASYTWYDGNASGATHESMESPVASFTLPARQWFGMTTSTPPDSGSNAVNVDKANQVGLYVGVGGGTRRRQAYGGLAGDNVTAITNYQTELVTTTNPGAPGANGFIGSVSSPGTLTSADGTSMKIDGAGDAKFKSLVIAGDYYSQTNRAWYFRSTVTNVVGPGGGAWLDSLTQSIPAPGPHAKFLVSISIDTEDVGANGPAVCRFYVDGALQSSEVVWNSSTSGERTPLFQQWLVTGLSAASHSFAVAGYNLAGAGNYNFIATHSTMSIIRVD